jgi:hypothetical protein
MFAATLTTEIPEGTVECESCHEAAGRPAGGITRNFRRITPRLSDPSPPVFVLALKRYAVIPGAPFRSVKITNRVEMDRKINLAEIPGSDATGIYILVGVVFHAGATANSGHYIAAFLDKTGAGTMWIYANDDKVTRHETFEDMEREVIRDNTRHGHVDAYILVYEKISGPLVDEGNLVDLAGPPIPIQQSMK